MLWVLGNSEGGDEIFGQGQQTPAINEQALGRIVAAFDGNAYLFRLRHNSAARLFMTHSEGHFKSEIEALRQVAFERKASGVLDIRWRWR